MSKLCDAETTIVAVPRQGWPRGPKYICWREAGHDGPHFNPRLRPWAGARADWNWRTDGRCPAHGISDCAPLLNGCSLLTRAER